MNQPTLETRIDLARRVFNRIAIELTATLRRGEPGATNAALFFEHVAALLPSRVAEKLSPELATNTPPPASELEAPLNPVPRLLVVAPTPAPVFTHAIDSVDLAEQDEGEVLAALGLMARSDDRHELVRRWARAGNLVALRVVAETDADDLLVARAGRALDDAQRAPFREPSVTEEPIGVLEPELPAPAPVELLPSDMTVDNVLELLDETPREDDRHELVRKWKASRNLQALKVAADYAGGTVAQRAQRALQELGTPAPDVPWRSNVGEQQS